MKRVERCEEQAAYLANALCCPADLNLVIVLVEALSHNQPVGLGAGDIVSKHLCSNSGF